MKVPEKVYLLFNRPYLVDYTKLNKRRNDEEVEYTHTEAFIEKACEWLKKNLKNYSSNPLGEEYLIDDFKETMKGE